MSRLFGYRLGVDRLLQGQGVLAEVEVPAVPPAGADGIRAAAACQNTLLHRVLRIASGQTDGVVCPKVRYGFGHSLRVLHLQAVRGAWEDKPLNLRQPLQEQPVCFPESGPEGIALAAQDGENRPGDAPGLRLAEAPTQQSWHIQLERSRRVGDCLREGAGQHPLDRVTILRSKMRLQEFVCDLLCKPLPEALLAPHQRVPVGGPVEPSISAGSSKASDWTMFGVSIES
jgi:hypothetical protein